MTIKPDRKILPTPWIPMMFNHPPNTNRLFEPKILFWMLNFITDGIELSLRDSYSHVFFSKHPPRANHPFFVISPKRVVSKELEIFSLQKTCQKVFETASNKERAFSTLPWRCKPLLRNSDSFFPHFDKKLSVRIFFKFGVKSAL